MQPEKRALIVDDEEYQLGALSEMMASFGIQSLTAVNGQDAQEKLATNDVDVILTDLVMLGMDGCELLRHLSRRSNATPIIVLTGFGSLEKTISVAHELKALWFLEKPVQAGILRELLERAMAMV